MGRLAIFDTETTGLPYQSAHARVIEVAVVIVDCPFQVRATWDSLCNPGRLMLAHANNRALQVNQLNRDIIRESPPDYLVGKKLRGFLRRWHVERVTSYNTAFDFHPHLLGAPQWLAPLMPPIERAPCLQELARLELKLGKWGKLSDIMAMLGIQRQGNPHEALSDALAATDLLIKLIKRSPKRPELWRKFFIGDEPKSCRPYPVPFRRGDLMAAATREVQGECNE